MSHSKEELAASLREAKLSPGSAQDLIPEAFTPTTNLTVAFNGKQANLGAFFRASECRLPPSITFEPEPEAPADTSYLFMLVDPDAPTPDDPKLAYWRHWVLPGLMPLSSDAGGTVAETKPALTAYLGPGPKDESKPHRYLLLLYREPAGLSLTKDDVGGEEFVDRRSFKAVEFVDKSNLKLVGVDWMTCAGDGWKDE